MKDQIKLGRNLQKALEDKKSINEDFDEFFSSDLYKDSQNIKGNEEPLTRDEAKRFSVNNKLQTLFCLDRLSLKREYIKLCVPYDCIEHGGHYKANLKKLEAYQKAVLNAIVDDNNIEDIVQPIFDIPDTMVCENDSHGQSSTRENNAHSPAWPIAIFSIVSGAAVGLTIGFSTLGLSFFGATTSVQLGALVISATTLTSGLIGVGVALGVAVISSSVYFLAKVLREHSYHHQDSHGQASPPNTVLDNVPAQHDNQGNHPTKFIVKASRDEQQGQHNKKI